jgi:hypothetical protein
MLDILEHMYDPWKTLAFCNKQAMPQHSTLSACQI